MGGYRGMAAAHGREACLRFKRMAAAWSAAARVLFREAARHEGEANRSRERARAAQDACRGFLELCPSNPRLGDPGSTFWDGMARASEEAARMAAMAAAERRREAGLWEARASMAARAAAAWQRARMAAAQRALEEVAGTLWAWRSSRN